MANMMNNEIDDNFNKQYWPIVESLKTYSRSLNRLKHKHKCMYFRMYKCVLLVIKKLLKLAFSSMKNISAARNVLKNIKR